MSSSILCHGASDFGGRLGAASRVRRHRFGSGDDDAPSDDEDVDDDNDDADDDDIIAPSAVEERKSLPAASCSLQHDCRHPLIPADKRGRAPTHHHHHHHHHNNNNRPQLPPGMHAAAARDDDVDDTRATKIMAKYDTLDI